MDLNLFVNFIFLWQLKLEVAKASKINRQLPQGQERISKKASSTVGCLMTTPS
jgi:hypothetical protein